MNLSVDTENFLAYLDNYSNNSLRKRNDIAYLFEVGATYQESAEIFNNLIFAGKSVYNIYSSLKKYPENEEGTKLLKKELEINFEKLRELLNQISEFSDEEFKNRILDIYLDLTAGNLRNLIDLAHDLSIIKNLQNDVKHNKV